MLVGLHKYYLRCITTAVDGSKVANHFSNAKDADDSGVVADSAKPNITNSLLRNFLKNHQEFLICIYPGELEVRRMSIAVSPLYGSLTF